MSAKLWLIVPVLAWATGALSNDDAINKDLQQFQGTWQAVSIQNFEGQSATAEEILGTRLVVKGNAFALTAKDASISGTFRIDPTKSPKTIDVMLTNAKPEDSILGIYRIEGKTRKSCFALPRMPRPSDFQPGQKGYLMLEWKPAP